MFKTVVLAVLVTLCYGQNMTDFMNATTMDATTMIPDPTSAQPMTTIISDPVMPTPAVSMTPNVSPTATSPPPIRMYDGIRTYRTEEYYQEVYQEIYNRSDVREARLRHFNVRQFYLDN